MPKEREFIKSFFQFSMGQWIAALISFITAIVINRSNITQRGISEKTGLSLGMVNILLKKFSKKGFVKLEKLNGKSFRYILTPEGFKEKSKKTIEYMKIFHGRTLLIKQNIERIIQT